MHCRLSNGYIGRLGPKPRRFDSCKTMGLFVQTLSPANILPSVSIALLFTFRRAAQPHGNTVLMYEGIPALCAPALSKRLACDVSLGAHAPVLAL